MELSTVNASEKVVAENEPDLDLDGLRRPDEFAAFALWLSMPPLIRKPPRDKNGNRPSIEEFCEQMGIEDEQAIKLIGIKTMQEFAKEYGVHYNTLTKWKKAIKQRDVLSDIRVWANDLNANVIFALYNKVIRGGLPEHYKLWFQVVAQWSEKIRIDHRVIRTVNLRVIESPHAVPVRDVEPVVPAETPPTP